MKKFLMAALAVFMMAGTAVATERIAVVENGVVTMASDNIADKMIALVKEHTKKIDAAQTLDAFNAAYEAFQQALTEFSEKNAAEIAAFDKNISAEEQKKYETELQKVIKQLEKTVEKKAMKFLGE